MFLLTAIWLLSTVASGQAPISGDAQNGSATQALQGKTQLPPRPAGRATVIGGRIDRLDTVRDRFVLKIYGGHQSMKVLYDARTQMFRDGIRVPLQSLRQGERASVETTLDGTAVFANAIHVLGQTPKGECLGQVMHFDPGAGAMTVRCSLTADPVSFLVGGNTSIVRVAQAGSKASPASAGDLVKGSLVSVRFEPATNGEALAREIAITATPGMPVVFTGVLVAFDLHTGRLVVSDGPQGVRYDISFDPAQIPAASTLSEGSHVTVTANFDGTGYKASDVRVN
jgi:hypothetical protein